MDWQCISLGNETQKSVYNRRAHSQDIEYSKWAITDNFIINICINLSCMLSFFLTYSNRNKDLLFGPKRLSTHGLYLNHQHFRISGVFFSSSCLSFIFICFSFFFFCIFHKCYWSAACLFTQVPLSPIVCYLAPVCRFNTSSTCSLVLPLTLSATSSVLRSPHYTVHCIENLVFFVCKIVLYEEFCSLPT